MTATPVITTDVQLSVPPRVGLVVEADADTVTVTRIVDGAREVLINGRDAQVAGSTYIDDYTVPYGVPVQYVATSMKSGVASDESAPTDPVIARIYTTGLWLSDPTIPGSDLEVRVENWDEMNFATQTDVVLPLGGVTPIALLAPLQSAEFTLTTRADRPEQRQAIQQLLRTCPIPLLRPSPVLEEPARYCTHGGMRRNRRTIGHYLYEIPLTEVAPPPLATQYGEVGKRYQDLPDYYTSYDDPALTSRTYIDLARDPRP